MKSVRKNNEMRQTMWCNRRDEDSKFQRPFFAPLKPFHCALGEGEDLLTVEYRAKGNKLGFLFFF